VAKPWYLISQDFFVKCLSSTTWYQ